MVIFIIGMYDGMKVVHYSLTPRGLSMYISNLIARISKDNGASPNSSEHHTKVSNKSPKRCYAI